MRKQLCVVHGKKTKPFICQSVEPSAQHIKVGSGATSAITAGFAVIPAST